MEFGIEKCVMPIMKSGKRKSVKGIELPNHESIRMLGEKENYKCLEILEADTIKQVEMKEKIRKLYLRRRKLLKTKLYSIYLIKEINIWAISLKRYAGPFLKWIKGGIHINRSKDTKVDDYAQSFMSKRWHRLYVSKKGGRGITSIKDCIDASIQWLEDYIKWAKKD